MKKYFNLVAFLLVAAAVTPASVFAQDVAGSGMAGFGGLMPLILIFVFFYLFLLRPQQKKAKQHQQLLNTLKRDDRIITAGGIYGTVINVKGNIIEIKIADDVNVQVAKQSISAVITKQDENAAQIPEIVKK